jgi:hypothetical protein
MAGRRDLHFDRLDDVMPEVERLLAGHVTVGDWSLGQICDHLAAAICLLLEGGLGVSPRPVPEAVRRRFLRRDRFPEGVEAPHPALLPPAREDRVGADALGRSIERFTAAAGPLPAHPYLGPMSKDEWARFHCLHCAHHLGFAVPI